MMRPTIYQLIQYVRDGETDKHIAEMIEHDPRGQKKLSQSRFICTLIGRQDLPSLSLDRDLPFAGDFSEPLVVERRVQSIESNRELPDEQAMSMSWSPRDEFQTGEVRGLVSGSVQSSDLLGTLIATDYLDHIELSFESPEQERRQEADRETPVAAQPEPKAAMADVADSDRVTIEGTDYTLTLQRRMSRGMPVQLKVQDASTGRDLDILYMPDSGPFFRARPNREGVLILEHLSEPGLLRIAGRGIDVLRIESKKISQNS